MEQSFPPPYQAESQNDAQDDQLVHPTIFVLAGQFIHIETPSSPPAYELSRGIATLTKATEKVEFERVDHTINAPSSPADADADDDGGGAAVPTVKRRRRHLYDLRRTAKQPRTGFARSRASSDAPEYYIHSCSRRALGHVGLCKASRGGYAAGFSTMPVNVAANQQVRFAQDGSPLFKLQKQGDFAQWVSAVEGGVGTVAVEDDKDSRHRHILMKAIRRKEVDALVALWCCRIWQDAAVKSETARAEVEGSKS